MLLFLIGLALKLMALIALRITSNPKRMDLLPPKSISEGKNGQNSDEIAEKKKSTHNFVEIKGAK